MFATPMGQNRTIGQPRPDGGGNQHEPPQFSRRFWLLSLAAIGVVFGDIGTSPIYAIRECFHGEFAIDVTTANVYGVLSLSLIHI